MESFQNPNRQSKSTLLTYIKIHWTAKSWIYVSLIGGVADRRIVGTEKGILNIRNILKMI